MLKHCLVAAVLLAGYSLAQAETKFYGMINKEIRSVSQDANENRVSKLNITDVDGFETRLGAKGNLKEDSQDIDYQIELGLNSNRDAYVSSSDERLRIRLAYVKWKNTWGDLTLGQAWTPDSIRLIQLDPMSKTSLQSFGLDHGYVAGSTPAKGLGYRMRYFQDQLSYQSPVAQGFRYHFTYDTNQKSAANSTSDDDGSFTTHMITYDKEFEGGKNELSLISSAYGENKGSNHKEKNLQIANKLTMGMSSLSLAYGTQTTGDDGKNKRAFVAYSYKREKTTYALSYSKLDLENASGTKTGSDTLIGLAAIHDCNSNLSLRLTLGQYTVKKETADTFSGGFTSNETENKAKLIAAGFAYSF